MATNYEQLSEVNDNLQKIHLSADIKSRELFNLEVRSTRLANDIMYLQDSIKDQSTSGRMLDKNVLSEERRSHEVEGDTNEFENLETLKNRHTENLNKIFEEIQLRQKKRREEYQQLMMTMIDRARMNPTTYKSLETIKRNVEQIKTEYLSVEEQLKEVQNELKILKTKFSDPDLDSEINSIDTFMDNTYQEYMNPEPMNSLLTEIQQLNTETEEYRRN
ncbi:uncharacterized protein LOC123305497 [Chrysoperla carnea]|uniref:uncharacterized protein LOC123305497 n=1 Tax=Chrysoperla carnea TaxID=189513 RepID=UPI001D070D5E|nr:uncharacterized protein LOC123305497 [Chrysoperla carnea]